MIQSISEANNSTPIKKRSQPLASSPVKPQKEHPSTQYVDSFVKHAKQSTPALLVLTAAWTAVDKISRNISIKKSLVNNLVGFFAPVLVVSSALLAGIENKKTPENTN